MEVGVSLSTIFAEEEMHAWKTRSVQRGLVWLKSRKARSVDVFTQRPPPLHPALCRPHTQPSVGHRHKQVVRPHRRVCLDTSSLQRLLTVLLFVPQETAVECIIFTDPLLIHTYICTMLKQIVHFVLHYMLS